MHGYQVFVFGYGPFKHLFNVGSFHDLKRSALLKRAARKGYPVIKWETALVIYKNGNFVKVVNG